MDIRLELKEVDYYEYYYILLKNNRIGKLSFKTFNDSIMIENISINENYRNEGYGTIVINHLKQKYTSISGASLPTAIGFWLKIGVEFEYYVDETMIDELMSLGEYPCFIIY